MTSDCPLHSHLECTTCPHPETCPEDGLVIDGVRGVLIEPDEVEEYRKQLLNIVCTKRMAIAIYGGQSLDMKKLAREANMMTRIPIADRHKILKFLIVKPLRLEDWL